MCIHSTRNRRFFLETQHAPDPRVRIWRSMMFAVNPFAELSASIPPAVMQVYVVIMIVSGCGRDVVRRRTQGERQVFLRQLAEVAEQRVEDHRWWRMGVARRPDRPRRRPDLRRILQPASPARPSSDHVRIPHLFRHDRRHGVRLPDARDAGAGYPAAALVDRRPDDLPRRILVLVLHSRRCRRRGQVRRCASCARICSSSRCWAARRWA